MGRIVSLILVVSGTLLLMAAPAVAQPSAGDWGKNAVRHRGKNGSHFTYRCPARSPVPLNVFPVWGDGVYTDNSVVCLAAVHSGRITYETGGTVTIEIGPGRDSYEGSTRNGIKSASWGAWPGSFFFVGTAPPGGGGEDAAAYRGEATKICNAAEKEIAALGKPASKPALARYLDGSLAAANRYLARLRRLDPPPALRSLHQRVVGIVEQEVALIGRLAAQVDAGADPAAALRAVEDELDALDVKEDAVWRKLGVTACL